MANFVGALFTSHGGYTTTPSEFWPTRRAERSYREDVPSESQDEMDSKWTRTKAGIAELRHQLQELKPDVVIIFGDDQEECFNFNNHPSLAVYLGQELSGFAPSPVGVNRDASSPREMKTAPGAPELATHILLGLMGSGFDPAFMLDQPKPEGPMAHAVMIPLGFFTDYDCPTVPILLNAYYAPQISGRRCYQLGRAVRTLIDTFPGDLRVVVIGSGGLWHTPGQKRSWLNEEFDRRGLSYLRSGDAAAWSDYFDSYTVAEDDTSQDLSTARGGISGLPGVGGPQFGTRETLCWIAAAATVEGRPSVVVDYVPVYASPVGIGFAYCIEP